VAKKVRDKKPVIEIIVGIDGRQCKFSLRGRVKQVHG